MNTKIKTALLITSVLASMNVFAEEEMYKNSNTESFQDLMIGGIDITNIDFGGLEYIKDEGSESLYKYDDYDNGFYNEKTVFRKDNNNRYMSFETQFDNQNQCLTALQSFDRTELEEVSGNCVITDKKIATDKGQEFFHVVFYSKPTDYTEKRDFALRNSMKSAEYIQKCDIALTPSENVIKAKFNRFVQYGSNGGYDRTFLYTNGDRVGDMTYDIKCDNGVMKGIVKDEYRLKHNK